MILLIEKRGFLAEATESEARLRNNRRDREFWRQAAHVPLSCWPVWRDKRIAAVLDRIPRWIDVWSLPDGDYVLRTGAVETMAVRPGGQILFTLPPGADPHRPREVLWQKGEPCPVALTPRDIAAMWDDRAHQARLERFDELLGAWNARAWWSDWEQEAADAALACARRGNWTEALARLDAGRADAGRADAGLAEARRYACLLTERSESD